MSFEEPQSPSTTSFATFGLNTIPPSISRRSLVPGLKMALDTYTPYHTLSKPIPSVNLGTGMPWRRFWERCSPLATTVSISNTNICLCLRTSLFQGWGHFQIETVDYRVRVLGSDGGQLVTGFSRAGPLIFFLGTRPIQEIADHAQWQRLETVGRLHPHEQGTWAAVYASRFLDNCRQIVARPVPGQKGHTPWAVRMHRLCSALWFSRTSSGGA
ncbi:uncharacterized protein BDV17DRAFT_117458 [Aspergillus undulatus]|uniref:uncharacterized protein n=1 Tax=Aspergillus undulatus TaxID=1810928 RepID=UPI003CCCC25B